MSAARAVAAPQIGAAALPVPVSPTPVPRPASPRTSAPLRLLLGGAQAGDATTRRMSTPAFAVLLTGVLVLAMLSTLVINISLTQGAFRLQEAQRQSRVLEERQGALTQAVVRAESPERIEAAARRLGMVPAASPVFLRLADGALIGDARPASTASTTGRR